MKKLTLTFLAIAALFIFGSVYQGSLTTQNAEAHSNPQITVSQNTSNNMCMLNLAEEVGGERCYQCDEGKSSGDCKGANRCRGTKSSCKSRGCAFTGGSSSSCTASNYKYCK